MRIKNLNKNNRPPVGSEPKTGLTNDGYDALNYRRNGDSTYYIKGHLLNGYLGGTGADFRNLTPLSRTANGEHDRKVETKVIDAIKKGKTVDYEVIPQYGRGAETPITGKKGKVKEVEQYVPKHLDCVATEMDETTEKYDKTIVSEPIDNDISGTYEIE
jgi:hypothetical protein